MLLANFLLVQDQLIVLESSVTSELKVRERELTFSSNGGSRHAYNSDITKYLPFPLKWKE